MLGILLKLKSRVTRKVAIELQHITEPNFLSIEEAYLMQ